jgi:hypothetical protein
MRLGKRNRRGNESELVNVMLKIRKDGEEVPVARLVRDSTGEVVLATEWSSQGQSSLATVARAAADFAVRHGATAWAVRWREKNSWFKLPLEWAEARGIPFEDVLAVNIINFLPCAPSYAVPDVLQSVTL